MSKFNAIQTARRVIETEINGLTALSQGLGAEFDAIVERLQNLNGRTIMAGVGKSGHVARKIAATLASTGTPALFVHPTEASHGDMGMITSDDAVIALSRSGETKELADMLAYCKRYGVPLIAVTNLKTSTLGKAADYILQLPETPEACAVTGAPTTSTTLQMALGDALAVALLEARGFTAGDFKNLHPGGALGAQLTLVSDLMHKADEMPLVSESSNMRDALQELSQKGFGCVGLVSSNDELVGIITDGDIRRNLDQDLLNTTASAIMTKSPKSVSEDTLAAEALHLMTAKLPQVMQLFVLNGKKPIGILHMHDLLRAGLG
ncbi:MAG: KpsF/GutQ family sugar-phosphate isomerase [Hyphomonadaceae bacterium]|nr:KpsF/GutQ family sugar-phosphate isomerase [Hyphomonadaceae bacterium]